LHLAFLYASVQLQQAAGHTPWRASRPDLLADNDTYRGPDRVYSWTPWNRLGRAWREDQCALACTDEIPGLNIAALGGAETRRYV
jgi:hypothetical protein